MSNVVSENNSNVIELNFGLKTESLDFDVPIDDPLEELLGEFEDLEIDSVTESSKDFIFHKTKNKSLEANFSQNSIEISDTILNQIEHVKEDLKRLTYYLDEMYIDK